MALPPLDVGVLLCNSSCLLGLNEQILGLVLLANRFAYIELAGFDLTVHSDEHVYFVPAGACCSNLALGVVKLNVTAQKPSREHTKTCKC